jgi:uncharacterized protein
VGVLKIASRCNLNCTYCYMYNLGDRTYLGQPKVMSDATIDAAVRRCIRHAAETGVETFRFVFHGGEPLLAGREKFGRVVDAALAEGRAAGVRPVFSVQTNGTLLDRGWCELFEDCSISLGVSLDGPERLNDRFRITHQGGGSYAQAVRGYRCAQDHGLRPGLLVVVDPETSPQEAFSHLADLAPRQVDFLLPEANHTRVPPRGSGDTPFADWLLAMFRLWDAAAIPPFGVRLFEQIIAATLGVPQPSDALGQADNEIVVIETDGEIGPVDVLRAAIPGAGRTGFNVHEHDISQAMSHPLLRLYHKANRTLCDMCAVCPINEICGGGYLPHRFGKDGGFDHPSVYCRDLTKLITTIRDATLATLPGDVLKAACLRPLAFRDAERTRALRAAAEG